LSTKPVPGQESGTQVTVATVRPTDLKHWIGALPYANRGAVLRSLNNELSLLNAARPALAMSFFGADEKVATLAAPPGTFHERGVLIVESPGSEARVRVRMNSLIDATLSCERFTYRGTFGNQ
jgi:hypothetical protein